MLEATSISKSYGTLQVLKAVSLKVEAHEIVSVVGASGAGKTTLLQILGSLSRPDSGNVKIHGNDLFSLGERDLSRFRNREIGFVFQFHHLLPEFTAFENVCIPGFIAGTKKSVVEKRAQELLQILDLLPRESHKPSQLSGGEKQRVAIARALINNPSVILADEPTGNLDTRTGGEIIELIKELNINEGVTVICSTHDEKMLAASNRVCWISDGQLDRIIEH